ncbi:MAG: zf-TFIIB domain-containing protein [Gammaproteobacteria bacterium]
MRCPKCGLGFESLRFETIDIDRCTGCGGIWLDATEKERLQELDGAGAIDTGNARLGRKYNRIQDAHCPRCDRAMQRMVDNTQFHIEFESCPTCGGTFFDAGEFRDLTDVTIAERLRQLLDTWLSVR